MENLEGNDYSEGLDQNGGGEQPATPSYVDADTFNRFREEISGHFKSLAESKTTPEKDTSTNTEISKPSLDKYDFKNDPSALEKFQGDWFRYYRHLEKAEEEKSSSQKREAESIKSLQTTHFNRVKDYRKENPEFDADIKKYGSFELYDKNVQAVYRFKNSAEIVHHLIKNREEAKELDTILASEGIEAVYSRLGEISAQIQASKSAAEGNFKSAAARPPRMNLRSTGSPGGRNLTLQQRFERFNGFNK